MNRESMFVPKETWSGSPARKFLNFSESRWWGGILSEMKVLISILIGLLIVGCGKEKQSAGSRIPPPTRAVLESLISDPIVEKALLKGFRKAPGELTEADLVKVTSLNLGNTQITDEGLKKISQLQQLTTLGIDQTPITDASLKEVAKLQNLNTLYLSRTKITDEGLKEVAKLQQLTKLSLSKTKNH